MFHYLDQSSMAKTMKDKLLDKVDFRILIELKYFY